MRSDLVARVRRVRKVYGECGDRGVPGISPPAISVRKQRGRGHGECGDRGVPGISPPAISVRKQRHKAARAAAPATAMMVIWRGGSACNVAGLRWSHHGVTRETTGSRGCVIGSHPLSLRSNGSGSRRCLDPTPSSLRSNGSGSRRCSDPTPSHCDRMDRDPEGVSDGLKC